MPNTQLPPFSAPPSAFALPLGNAPGASDANNEAVASVSAVLGQLAQTSVANPHSLPDASTAETFGSRAAPQSSKTWATPTDWELYHDEIVRLYIDDDKPLKEVMDVMATEHGFHATEKMYKIKIKKWNLKKNLKENEVQAIIQTVARREAANRASAVQIHGKDFDLSQIMRHAKKKRIVTSTQRRSRKKRSPLPLDAAAHLPSYVRIFTPSPPPQIRGPDLLQSQEEVLRTVRIYVDGKVYSREWTLETIDGCKSVRTRMSTEGNEKGLTACSFYLRFNSGIYLLREKRNSREAYRDLNIAFASLKPALEQQDPSLLSMILSVSLRIVKEGHAKTLGTMLWKYILQLSPYCAGTNSPLNSLWGPIGKAFLWCEDVGQTFVLATCLLDRLRAATQARLANVVQLLSYTCDIEELTKGSMPESQRTLRRMLDDLISQPSLAQDPILDERNIREQLGRSLLRDRQFEAGLEIINAMPQRILDADPTAQAMCWLQTGFACQGLADWPRAIEAYKNCVRIASEVYGEDSSSAMMIIPNLRLCYEKIGETEKAQEVFEDYQRRLNIVEQKYNVEFPSEEAAQRATEAAKAQNRTS